MANHFIYVQPGTEYIEFGEIPKLTSEAIYPLLPNESGSNEPTTEDFHRGIARIDHQKVLEQAEQAGMVKPCHPISLVPDSFNFGEHGPKRIVPVDQVQAFAEQLGILLVPASGKSEEHEGIQYGPMMTIEDIGAALALQHDVPAEAIVSNLVEAAREIGVRDPRTRLRVNPKTVRVFYDVLAVTDVNSWLEDQGVDYRLVLPEGGGRVGVEQSGIKKNALISKYSLQWRSAETDINEASRNGLKQIAALGSGFYDEVKAIAWAKARGKFKESAAANTMNSLTGLVHRPK